MPKDPLARAHARALAELIACDIHPLNNTSTLRYLKHQLHQEQSAIDAWYHHWVIEGFEALEALLTPGPYACGDKVTIADVCLVPGRQCAPSESAARQISQDRQRRCGLSRP